MVLAFKPPSTPSPSAAHRLNYRDGYRALDGTTVTYREEVGSHQHLLEGDGLLPKLYEHLYKSDTAKERRLVGVGVPDTVIFQHNFPRAWYVWDPETREIVRRPGKDLDTHRIFRVFASHRQRRDRLRDPDESSSDSDVGAEAAEVVDADGTSRGRRPPRRDFACEIVAQFFYANGADAAARVDSETAALQRIARSRGATAGAAHAPPDTAVQYMTREMLAAFLSSARTRPDGVLQRFVVPKGTWSSRRNSQLQAVWSPAVTLLYKRSNRNLLDDHAIPVDQRAATFDGSPHLSQESLVSSTTQRRIEAACTAIAAHISATEHKPVQRLVLYFKEDEDGRSDLMWLMCAASIRMGGDALHPLRVRVPVQLGMRQGAVEAPESPRRSSFLSPNSHGGGRGGSGYHHTLSAQGRHKVAAGDDLDDHAAAKRSELGGAPSIEAALYQCDTKLFDMTGDSHFARRCGGDVGSAAFTARRPRGARRGTTASLAGGEQTLLLEGSPSGPASPSLDDGGVDFSSPRRAKPAATTVSARRPQQPRPKPPTRVTAAAAHDDTVKEGGRGRAFSGTATGTRPQAVAYLSSSKPLQPPSGSQAGRVYTSARAPFFPTPHPQRPMSAASPRHPFHRHFAATDEARRRDAEDFAAGFNAHRQRAGATGMRYTQVGVPPRRCSSMIAAAAEAQVLLLCAHPEPAVHLRERLTAAALEVAYAVRSAALRCPASARSRARTAAVFDVDAEVRVPLSPLLMRALQEEEVDELCDALHVRRCAGIGSLGLNSSVSPSSPPRTATAPGVNVSSPDPAPSAAPAADSPGVPVGGAASTSPAVDATAAEGGAVSDASPDATVNGATTSTIAPAATSSAFIPSKPCRTDRSGEYSGDNVVLLAARDLGSGMRLDRATLDVQGRVRLFFDRVFANSGRVAMMLEATSGMSELA